MIGSDYFIIKNDFFCSLDENDVLITTEHVNNYKKILKKYYVQVLLFRIQYLF